MAIKSKSTDVFKGVISWICMLLVYCIITIFIVGLLSVILNSHVASTVGNFVETIQLQKGEIPQEIFYPVLSGLFLFLVAVVLIFLFREDRHRLEDSIAKALSRVWVEIKILLIFSTMFLALSIYAGPIFEPLIPLLTIILLIYFICLDIGRNRTFFRHNIIRSVLRSLTNFQKGTPFERRSLRQFFAMLCVILGVLILAGVALLFLISSSFWPFRNALYFLIGIFTLVAVLGTIFWYILALKRDLRDWNELMAQIQEMYGGNLNAVNHVSPTSNLYNCAMQLNMIRTGIAKAVEEGTKADRTKVELITNVSHDLKTPLTSIISYAELLKKEPDLPPHVMDYINTISQKSLRLNSIVQDVFEVSKAATGNISLNIELLDIGKMLQQILAEMEETLNNADVQWRIEIPDIPLPIQADGQRLYRVFQNLIRNCAQYSLEGSRAYITATRRDSFAQVSIRNISRNEITISDENLTARFVRGDENRTTEGSGLGLSIAKSFTEACGGRFSVHSDGDLFTVSISFPLVAPAAPIAPPPVIEPENPEIPEEVIQ